MNTDPTKRPADRTVIHHHWSKVSYDPSKNASGGEQHKFEFHLEDEWLHIYIAFVFLVAIVLGLLFFASKKAEKRARKAAEKRAKKATEKCARKVASSDQSDKQTELFVVDEKFDHQERTSKVQKETSSHSHQETSQALEGTSRTLEVTSEVIDDTNHEDHRVDL